MRTYLVMRLRHREGGGTIGSYGFAIAALLISGAPLWVGIYFPSIVHAETKFVPSMFFAETYDTNIWFSPAQFLPPGTKLNDFGSTLGGRGEFLYKEREVEASVAGGVDATVFARNTGLNYINTKLEGKAKLDSWLHPIAKGAQLRFAESFRYTPASPSFLTGVKPGAVDDPFLRGIQSFRANTFANTTSLTSVLPIFRDLGLDARYSFSLLRVGSVLAATGTGASFFDTTTHSGSIGPRYNLTRLDSVILSYQPTFISQTVTTGGAPIETTTQTAYANYLRVVPKWTLDIGAGVTHVSLGNRAFPVGNIRIQTDVDRVTVYRVDISRRAAPSFFFVAGALISNVGQVAVSHKLSRVLTAQGSVNYGYNATVPDATVTFTNFTTSVGVNYKISKILMLDLTYSYIDFKQNAPGLSYEIPRNVVGFTLSAEWK